MSAVHRKQTRHEFIDIPPKRMEDLTDPNNSRHIRNADIIIDVIIAVTYSAEVEWPQED